MVFLISHPKFYGDLGDFRTILGKLGGQQGSLTSQKGSGVANFRILIPLSVFSDQKTYPYQICEQHDHFIEIYVDLGVFGPFLGKIGGP